MKKTSSILLILVLSLGVLATVLFTAIANPNIVSAGSTRLALMGGDPDGLTGGNADTTIVGGDGDVDFSGGNADSGDENGGLTGGDGDTGGDITGGNGDETTVTTRSFYMQNTPNGTEINKRIGQVVTLVVSYTLGSESSSEGTACNIGISNAGYSNVTGAEKSSYPDSAFSWRPVEATPIGSNQYICRGIWETNLSTQTGYHVFAAKIAKQSGGDIAGFSYVNYVKVVDTENNGTISLNVASTTIKQGESVRLTGQPSNVSGSNKSCYFYVGNSGNYILKAKSALGECAYDWNTAGTAEGLHSVLVNIQDTDEPSPSWSRMPSDTESIRVCATTGESCKTPNKISIWADPAGVTQGKPMSIHVYISNPNDSELANKQEYYLFVGDGNGRHYLKTHGSTSSCSQSQQGCVYNWSTGDDTVVGLHSVVVSLQDRNLSSPTVFASPNVQTTVRVCAKDAGSCNNPNQGPNQGPGGPGDNGGGGLGQAATQTIPDLLSGSRDASGKQTARKTAVLPSAIQQITQLKFETIYELLKIVAFKWFPVAIGAAALIGIIIAGFTIVMAGGDAEKAKKGRLAIVYIATGMIIATLAWLIVKVVVIELVKLNFLQGR